MDPIIVEGRNCWRIARASEVGVLVDAAPYYKVMKQAMEAAKARIFIVGWDFDTRVVLDPDARAAGVYRRRETLGRFLRRLARQNPALQIDILKWNFGAMKQWFRFQSAKWLLRWWRQPNIDFRFDSSHPFGCSHHQKIIILDDSLAACGGIDIADRRWDTSDHLDHHPHRVSPGGRPFAPWHDATVLMRGPIAKALGELGRERWRAATKADLPPAEAAEDDWPDGLPVLFRDCDVAIARTRAEYGDCEAVHEIETLYIDMIAGASRFLYFENQYFTSAKIGAALADRLAQPDPPEVVMVMPRKADGWLEQKAMDSARQRLLAAIDKVDHAGRFQVYVPVTRGGTDIYVHAKVSVVDDRLLRVGSSNLNNRSMALDSECDVVLDCGLPGNDGHQPAITSLRHRLIAEHLGCSVDDYAAAEQGCGSMIGAIEKLAGAADRKSLTVLEREKVEGLDAFIADQEILDPANPDAMFDPIADRGLKRQWRMGKQAMRRRGDAWRARRARRSA